jgi:hypothetical protein
MIRVLATSRVFQKNGTPKAEGMMERKGESCRSRWKIKQAINRGDLLM